MRDRPRAFTFAGPPGPALSPLSRQEGQVHPLLLSRPEADAGLAVKILHGRHNGVPLHILCSGRSVRRRKGVGENSLPSGAPPTVFIADNVGDPHFPIRRFGPQAVKSFVQAFHSIPVFGNVQISLQEELAGAFWRKIKRERQQNVPAKRQKSADLSLEHGEYSSPLFILRMVVVMSSFSVESPNQRTKRRLRTCSFRSE